MKRYRALVTRVYDGDTITADIDLGFGVLLTKQKLRLNSVKAPEIRGKNRAAGLISRDALREKIESIPKTKINQVCEDFYLYANSRSSLSAPYYKLE